MYIGAAVGVELSTDWYAEEDLLNTLAYNLWNALEEGLEMAAVVLFMYALLGYMGQGQDVPVDVIIGERSRQVPVGTIHGNRICGAGPSDPGRPMVGLNPPA